MSGIKLALLLAIMQQIGFTIETSAIHAYGGALTISQMSFVRCLGGIGMAVAWAVVTRDALRTHHLTIQLLRGGSTFSYGLALMWGFAVIPLLDATAISYLTAIWIVALAPLIGERWTAQRISAVVIGFVGALLVIRPTFSDANLTYVAFALLAALNGGNFLMSRYTQDRTIHGDRVDSPATVLFWANGIAAVLTAWPAFASPWEGGNPMLLISIGIIGPLAMFVGIIALRYIAASTIAPINYVRLILIGLIAPLLMYEPVSLLSAVGGALIVAGCWIAVARVPSLREQIRPVG